MQTSADFNRFQDVTSALGRSLAAQKPNEYWQSSALWNDFFDNRKATDSYTDLNISLNDKYNYTKGIATQFPDSKKPLFANYCLSFFNKALLEKFEVSPVGTPSVFSFAGKSVSIPFLFNLRLLSDLQKYLEKYKITGPLHVLEIGAGFGGLAYFLLKSGLAQSYTVIDLVQNLEISAFHLSQNFKDMKVNALTSSDRVQSPERGSLNFLTPGNIEALATARFDLVVNTDSLGEMPKETAIRYIEWIHQHLAEGGHFFSKNGHRRGADTVPLPSQYGYSKFEALEFSPPTGITGLFDDFSHFAFLRKSGYASSYLQADNINALFSLYALGLQGELSGISSRLASNSLTDSDQTYLSMAHLFFAEKSLPKKLKILRDHKAEVDGKNTRTYLEGIVQYLLGLQKEAMDSMKNYLVSCDSYIGESYALMIISRRSPAILSGPFKFGVRTEFAIDELRGFQKLSAPMRTIAYRLRADILRKKINYPGNYTPGTLVKIKNLVFNLKEGKGFSAVR